MISKTWSRIYLGISCVGMLIGNVSCDPSRIEAPPLGRTEAAFFTNVVEFRQNLVSVYAKLYDFYFFNPDWEYADCPSSLWLLPGDDLTETEGARTPEELFDGGMNPSNHRITFVFDQAYELIARANVTIEKTRTVNYAGWKGEEEIKQMEGECLFLRGYAYFKLFNIYGNVPLITRRITSQDSINTPVSDKLVILDQVIDDASDAIEMLPVSWPVEFLGRATKNSARGLLAKALVFRANYSGNSEDYYNALQVFGQIEADLEPVFTDNFNAFAENNQESLFEVQASQSTTEDNMLLSNDGPWRGVECMTIFRGWSQVNGTRAANDAQTKFLITQKLYGGFSTDPRISVFLLENDGFEGLLFQKYTLSDMDHLVSIHSNSVNNERVLRYSDLKLIAAEAALKTDQTEVAIRNINDVRARARTWARAVGEGDGATPADYNIEETDFDKIMRWIMDERFVELAGEGHRWWDLKRWHSAGNIDLTGWAGGNNEFSSRLTSPVKFDVNKHLLFPIPQAEVERNKAIFQNNPGY